MAEKEITQEEEMMVDDGRNILAGYMRYYSHSPNVWQPPPVKEVSGETHFYELDNPGIWSQFKYRTN